MPETPSTVDGLRAIELSFRPLRDIATGRSVCYLARTQLNTPGLGTLMPETFRPAADASGKSAELFGLEMMQLAESILALKESERNFRWASQELPLSLLRDRTTVEALEKICENYSVSPGSFCFTVPEKTLDEKDDNAAENIAYMRKLGFHVMLTGFGESGCPYIRLSEFLVDYVMLSPAITLYIGKSERSDQAVRSIITFINDLGCEPVADGVKSSTQAEKLYSFGCTYCAGPLSGEYLSLSQLTSF
ncbi:MAG: EAL domain-containing protein [Clostridia bacterium]|nr:EAL domain-containing protein [Clostridia bacterium]